MGTLPVTSGTKAMTNDTGYSRTFWDGGFCSNCTRAAVGSPGFFISNIGDNNKGYCVSDAYRPAYYNFLQKAACGWMAEEVPQNFYYNYSSNLFVCLDTNICGNVTPATVYQNELLDSGFEAAPSADAQEMAGIGCVGNKPVLKFAGVDVFDYRLWGVLFLVIIMLYAWVNYIK
jgi:hypothetical protein